MGPTKRKTAWQELLSNPSGRSAGSAQASTSTASPADAGKCGSPSRQGSPAADSTAAVVSKPARSQKREGAKPLRTLPAHAPKPEKPEASKTSSSADSLEQQDSNVANGTQNTPDGQLSDDGRTADGQQATSVSYGHEIQVQKRPAPEEPVSVRVSEYGPLPAWHWALVPGCEHHQRLLRQERVRDGMAVAARRERDLSAVSPERRLIEPPTHQD